ncbi:MAG: prepilin-type N-terminal cleavage/methylation domain-containing protein, partial [Candidatus Magasanikbacteria bacterium]|nr:prepilin-type N-terminal cleavage/methylation domain-containing protein [Candidatus Magasanikbacteria bacterium]
MKKIDNKHKKGYTLTELVVALGVFTIFLVFASYILVYSLRSNSIIFEQLTTQSESRRTMKEVTDKIRIAEESSLGSFAIEMADDYELIIYANIDEDVYRERVRFWLDNTTLKEGIIEPTGNPLEYLPENESVVELSHNVVNYEQGEPLFLYYDGSYTGTES